MRRPSLLLLVPVAVLQAGSAGDPAPVVVARELDSTSGAVVCVDHLAAWVGAEVLADGGNAVDAAVAMGFALAVTYPAAGNLGGGGFLLAHFADGRSWFLDYRETAPAAAHPEMFLDESGAIDPAKTQRGYPVVGVPGTVAGLAMAHELAGSLPWQRLVRPSRELAAEGIVVDEDLAATLAEHGAALRQDPGARRCFFHPDGSPLEPGDVLRQPDLANSLRWIEEDGPRAFYEGPIAALLDAAMQQHGGPVRAADLAAYRAVLREPLRFAYGGFEVLAAPPPSSGGVALAQILGILEPLELRREGPGSATLRHFLAEAQRRAFAERAAFLGDPAGMTVPVEELISAPRLAKLRASISTDHASVSGAMGPDLTPPGEPSHTTHFSVIDRHGNAVSNTYTLEDPFGAKVVAEGTGFLLNDELSDFNLKPGLTDASGNIGTPPNLAHPGRRPLSSMSPVIVLEEGSPVLVTGSPGGRTIINTVACILLLVLECDVELPAAVAWPRQHHQWFPDELRVERGVGEEVIETLRALGHSVRVEPRLGDAHSLARDPTSGEVQAVPDRRLDGWAAAPRD